jgi:hypothetical protein
MVSDSRLGSGRLTFGVRYFGGSEVNIFLGEENRLRVSEIEPRFLGGLFHSFVTVRSYPPAGCKS